MSLLAESYAKRVNNLTLSIELGEHALYLSRKLGRLDLIGKSLNQLSLFYMILGQYKKTSSLAEEAIECFQKLNDKKGIADAKYNLAGIYYRTDNYHLGLVYLIDCLNIYKRYKDFHNQARVQKSLGTIYEYFGDEKNAVSAYESSIEAAKKCGDINLESNAYNPLSGIYIKQNNIGKAQEIIERSVAIKSKTSDLRGLAFAIYGRAKVYQAKGQQALAVKDFTEALALHLKMGEKLGTAMTYAKLGRLYAQMGQISKAKKMLLDGLKLSNTFNIVFTKFKCCYLLYELYKQENDPIKSLKYLETYLKLKEAVINTQTLKVIENYEMITKMRLLEKKSRQQMKIADEQIKLNNERYELATKATKDVIWDWDIEKNRIYRSANYETIFGYDHPQVPVLFKSWTELVHDDDRNRIIESINNSIQNEHSHVWEDEYRYCKLNGELAYVMDRGYIIRDANGRATRMVGAMMDVSAQKVNEKEKEKITNDLIQRNKDLEQFAYIISHNLRAPVANILGFSELLKDPENTVDESQDFINSISHSAITLDGVISDLNTILQIKSEISETKKKIRFSDLVSDIQLSIKGIIESEDVNIRTNFNAINEFTCLKSYMYSIFYNLITNAIKYRQADKKPVLEIKSAVLNGRLNLSFKDNGQGIDLAKRGNQVFGLYKRFHPNIEGRGVGLYMTKTQVETLGGRISLKSEVNKGSEFIIEFDL